MGGWYTIGNVGEVFTPALAVYPERIEENIRRMIAIAGGTARLRPHIKTHKMGEVVRMNLAQGISKFKCATISEAEMAAAAGAKDILIAYQPVGPNVERLAKLARGYPEVRFAAITDDIRTLRALGKAFAGEGKALPVYLDIDCGMGRSGVSLDGEGFEVYQELSRTPGLEPAGLHAYDGHIHEKDARIRERVCADAFAQVERFKLDLERNGLEVPVIVAGGTPTFAIHARFADRECSPGTCVLWDFGYQENFPDLDFLVAAVLVTRIVSKPLHNRLCLDLGYKAVAAESQPPRVMLPDVPEAVPLMHHEEHLVVETPRAVEFAVGQALYAIPRHICPSVALHDLAVVVTGGAASGIWTVAGRSRVLSL